MNTREPVYYGDYLQLDKILDAHELQSKKYGKEAHDENLFIIIHQTYELWFKQMLIEIDSVRDLFDMDYVPNNVLNTAVSRFKRVAEILKVLINQMTVIETMTPLDFMEFRDFLLPASGFQSVQFRLFETALGLKFEFRSDVEKGFFDSRLNATDKEKLKKAEQRKSLFELVEAWLERMPFSNFGDFNFWEEYKNAVGNMLNKDENIIKNNPTLNDLQRKYELKNLEATKNSFAHLFDSEKHQSLVDKREVRLSQKATLASLFIHIYRDEPILNLPFQLLDSIVEIDELITTWRYRHAIMAQRILGTKIGTGGSSGHDYLKKTTESCRVFVDFFNLPTFLIPKTEVPELPADLRKELGFHFDKR